ncbi:hypothetical protein XENORESO_011886, partial [Xenotaenia resolanae]
SPMSGAAFPSPTVEMAEINRIQYELEYTEGISQKMRIPQKLKVAPQAHDEPSVGLQEVPPSVIMQVPERISRYDVFTTTYKQHKSKYQWIRHLSTPSRFAIIRDATDPQFSRPRDLDLIQSTPLETLALKTPPRVLTLSEGPLHFLEEEHQIAPGTDEVVRPQGRLRRERSASENAAVHLFLPSSFFVFPHLFSKPSLRGGSALGSNPMADSRAYGYLSEMLPAAMADSVKYLRGVLFFRLALSTYESSLEGPADDLTVVDATTLRRQLIKLNRRLQHLEEENKERAKREMIMYSISVAFWLINTWVWLRR